MLLYSHVASEMTRLGGVSWDKTIGGQVLSIFLFVYCITQRFINPWPVFRFAWKTVAEMAENRDLGRGPLNITSSGSLEMVGLSTLI